MGRTKDILIEIMELHGLDFDKPEDWVKAEEILIDYNLFNEIKGNYGNSATNKEEV